MTATPPVSEQILVVNDPPRLLIGWSSLQGDRPTQEDALLVDHGAGLMGVFDGLGGHTHGRYASRLAAQVFARMAHATRAMGADPDQAPSPEGLCQLANEILVPVSAEQFDPDACVQDALRRYLEISAPWALYPKWRVAAAAMDLLLRAATRAFLQENPHRGSDTTATLAVPVTTTDANGQPVTYIVVGWQGDSPLWLWRDGARTKVTTPHCLPPPNENVVLATMRGPARELRYVTVVATQPGDMWVLGSDGLCPLDAPQHDRTWAAANQMPCMDAAFCLSYQATVQAKGAADNATCIVWRTT